MQTTFACALWGKLTAEAAPMAIYHLSVKTISRSAGRSATAAAAYRAGVEITDQRTGEIHDYTRKGGVESAAIILPDNAQKWASDRAQLWNAAEQAEKRKNSTVAREFEIALPAELDAQQRQKLAHDFARELVKRHGCAADVAIHAPGKEGDNRNYHAHILLTTRRLDADGFGEKTRELDDQKTGKILVLDWRERFATLQNERLREAGHAVQVDHRSHAERGLEAEPSRHLGPTATAIERRTGQRSRVGQAHDQEALERLARAKETGELEREARQVERSIIDLSGDLEAAKKERDAQRLSDFENQTRAQIAAFKAQRIANSPQPRINPAEAERQRLERLSSAELLEELRRRQLPSVESQVEKDRAVIESTNKSREIYQKQEAAKAFADKAERALYGWREQHPTKAKMHDAGVWRSSELEQLEQQAEQRGQALWTLKAHAQALGEQDAQIRKQAASRVRVAQSDDRAALGELERLHLSKSRQEREAVTAARDLEDGPQEFRTMALGRENKSSGWSDSGSKWKATPDTLKKLIDGYNAASPEVRAQMLAGLTSPKAQKNLRVLLDTQQTNYRQSNDRGMSR